MPKLAALAHNQCRYPVTEEAPYVFCGRQKVDDSSYCARHHVLCIRKRVRPIEFLADWANQTDPHSKAVRPQPEERARPLDEVLT